MERMLTHLSVDKPKPSEYSQKQSGLRFSSHLNPLTQHGTGSENKHRRGAKVKKMHSGHTGAEDQHTHYVAAHNACAT